MLVPAVESLRDVVLKHGAAHAAACAEVDASRARRGTKREREPRSA